MGKPLSASRESSPIHRRDRGDGLPCLRLLPVRAVVGGRGKATGRREFRGDGGAPRLTCDDYGHPRYVRTHARTHVCFEKHERKGMAAPWPAFCCAVRVTLESLAGHVHHESIDRSPNSWGKFCRAGNKAATHEHDFLSLYAAATAAAAKDSTLLLHDSKAPPPPPSQGLHAQNTPP